MLGVGTTINLSTGYHICETLEICDVKINLMIALLKIPGFCLYLIIVNISCCLHNKGSFDGH